MRGRAMNAFDTGIPEGMGQVRPALEKELIQYEVLSFLADAGALDLLTFQGGTCLHLCYGSPRFSEDLDFTAGERFGEVPWDSVARDMGERLSERFGTDVRVKEPKLKRFDSGGASMARWTVTVDTAPERPDMPSQRLKVEVASVPSHTREARRVATVLEPERASSAAVACQSLVEIAADKLVSFADTERYIRYRDLWDLPWIAAQGANDHDLMASLVRMKHREYCCPDDLDLLLHRGRARARRAFTSDDFAAQMRRFLTSDIYRDTAAHASWRADACAQVVDTYEAVAQALGIDLDCPHVMAKAASALSGTHPSPGPTRREGKHI